MNGYTSQKVSDLYTVQPEEYQPIVLRGKQYSIVGVLHDQTQEPMLIANAEALTREVHRLKNGVPVCESDGGEFCLARMKRKPEFLEEDHPPNPVKDLEEQEMKKPLVDFYMHFRILADPIYSGIASRTSSFKTNPHNYLLESTSANDLTVVVETIAGYDARLREELVWKPRLEKIQKENPGLPLVIECGATHAEYVEHILKGKLKHVPSFKRYLHYRPREDREIVEKFQKRAIEYTNGFREST